MQQYKTIEDNPAMGLNNKICQNRVYFCNYHKVYMSQEDVDKEGCQRRQTFDMMSTYKCSYLLTNS